CWANVAGIGTEYGEEEVVDENLEIDIF
uniref:Uncharacterized protein n=1 Tax=Panagrolaimus sp. ES5 TaxID=591445 RepID=A0AC34G658_9BILA